MKLLLVLPYIPSEIRVRPYQFIKRLAARHEVTIIASASARELHEVEGIRALCREVRLVPLHRLSAARGCGHAAMSGLPLQAGYCRSAEFDSALSKLLDRESFDLVHVEHLRAAHAWQLIPRGLPAVYDSVDSISLLLERTLRSSHSLLQRAIAALELRRCRRYEAELLGRFSHVTVTSPEDRLALLALQPNGNVTVVPNGVDLDYFQPVSGVAEPATIVFSGKMSYHANVTAVLHFAQEIFPLVRRQRPDARLLVVGSNPSAAVLALARDPAITVTGYVPDIRVALGKATVSVCPVTVKVGIQNKILEAMAMGLPVVSTATGIQGLWARPGGDVLVGSDPAEFSGQVCRLLEDQGLRATVGASGRRYVEKYHRWDVATQTLEQVYAAAQSTERILAA